MKKKPRLIYPEILICGYPRSGTSLVAEIVYLMTGYPKPNGLIYRGDGYVGYNEFFEIMALFHTYVHEMYSEDFFLTERYKDDVMWQEQIKAVSRFLERKRCLVFKENHLLSTIGGFREHFNGRKVIYVERDITDVYRSVCKAKGQKWNSENYTLFIKEYSKTINRFTSSWAWKDALKIQYDMLVNEKMVTIKRIADYLGIFLTPNIIDRCTGYIKMSK